MSDHLGVIARPSRVLRAHLAEAEPLGDQLGGATVDGGRRLGVVAEQHGR
jgi:hypothetical protein